MKAHSERVPNKNFRPFAGKPLCQWILDSLLTLEEIDLVVMNTDARVQLQALGIRDSDRMLIRDRKTELCGDMVSMNKILGDDVENVPAETYMMTHTTNPLLSETTMRRALKQFHLAVNEGTADSLFTVNRFQSRFYRADGSAVNHDPTNLLRTQDLEPWFEENSNLYIFTCESFRSTNARIGRKPLLFETPRLESVDIDNTQDFELAELIASSLKNVVLTGDNS